MTAAATEFSKVKLCVCFRQGGEAQSEMQQRWGCPEERDPGESQAKATTIPNISFLIPPASRSARGHLGEPVKGIYHRCAGHGVTQRGIQFVWVWGESPGQQIYPAASPLHLPRGAGATGRGG